MNSFHRSECTDCVDSNSSSLHRLYQNVTKYEIAVCQNNLCSCIRPYVADRHCHHVASPYGLGRATFLFTEYLLWLPIYLFFIFGVCYLLVDKCSAPQLKKNLRGKHRYNKKQNSSFCRCNFSIVILSLILSGLLLRGTYLFVDPLNMFHMVPSSLKSLFLNCGTSCWLSSAIITIECFVRSTQLALKLRVSVKDERRLRCASVSGTAALMVYGVTNLVVRYMDGFDQVYGFMNDYRVMIDGLCCLVLMILAMYHGHQAVRHLGDNQRLFKSSPRNTQTPSTQHKRTTSTPARRTRRNRLSAPGLFT